jgi:two-component system, NarL family, nitrate/nitrite response regulator NarL
MALCRVTGFESLPRRKYRGLDISQSRSATFARRVVQGQYWGTHTQKMEESRVELLLRSWLIKDALSLVLAQAGFAVFHEPIPSAKDTTTIIDFDDCSDRDVIRAHQQRRVKIVALAYEANGLQMNSDDVAALSGILTYDLSAAAFVRALQLICSGERVIPRDLALGRRPQISSLGTEPRSDRVQLSPREKEMLSHLTAGDSNKAIARHLGITEATVKVHLKSVLRKIRVENRTQAAIWALANLPELSNAPRRIG